MSSLVDWVKQPPYQQGFEEVLVAGEGSRRHAEELVHFVATQVGQDRFKPPWARLTLGDAIAEHTGVDIYAQRSTNGGASWSTPVRSPI